MLIVEGQQNTYNDEVGPDGSLKCRCALVSPLLVTLVFCSITLTMADHTDKPAAGSSTREMARQRYGQRVVFALKIIAAMLFLVSCLFYLSQNNSRIPVSYALGATLFLAAAYLAIYKFANHEAVYYFRREARANQGAIAEESVGAILDRLPTETHAVFHDVLSRHGNIDHIVFRRDGAIFLIETKSHRGIVTEKAGQLYRDGQDFEKNIVQQTLSNISDLRGLLAAHFKEAPWITAAIVFTSARVPLWCKIKNISVINASYLERWMSKQNGKQSAGAISWALLPELRKVLPHA